MSLPTPLPRKTTTNKNTEKQNFSKAYQSKIFYTSLQVLFCCCLLLIRINLTVLSQSFTGSDFHFTELTPRRSDARISRMVCQGLIAWFSELKNACTFQNQSNSAAVTSLETLAYSVPQSVLTIDPMAVQTKSKKHTKLGILF